jgi:hypothetical protein
MNIEEIVAQIKETEEILKNYSFTLKSYETGNYVDGITDYRVLMKILEEKANYLFNLKKRYNELYKMLNNI